ncbi:MAG: phage tail sheath family protein, partial [Gammaproteobacteria bacterium]
GVYVEEVPGTPPIAGVGTSTAAFIGEVNTAAPFQMPLKPGSDTDRFPPPDIDKAVLVTNFEQFKTKFGDIQPGNKVLAHAVFGFFLNGGTRCWVIRVDTGQLLVAAAVISALSELEKIDEIAIVAAPGALAADVQLAIIEHCEDLKDRFAIIDGQITTDINVPQIQGTVRDSNYAALYFPRIEVVDQTLVPTAEPIEKWRPAPGAHIFVPPSAHVAGIYARVDETRGVHKAPANEVVRGALALEYLVTHNEQKGLNPEGINVIRGFNGNIRVWGARTLGGKDNGEFVYINVRRLMNFLRESIEEGTNFVVFEPNNPALWQRIIRSVTGFLTNVWRDGALFGNTPEEAFFVKCDETTNPPEVRELGQVVTEIGVAIVKPAEFVIFRISQLTGSAA